MEVTLPETILGYGWIKSQTAPTPLERRLSDA